MRSVGCAVGYNVRVLSFIIVACIAGSIPLSPGEGEAKVEAECNAFSVFALLAIQDMNNTCSAKGDRSPECGDIRDLVIITYLNYWTDCHYRRQENIDENSWIWLLP